jgi:hypothetical protein
MDFVKKYWSADKGVYVHGVFRHIQHIFGTKSQEKLLHYPEDVALVSEGILVNTWSP